LVLVFTTVCFTVSVVGGTAPGIVGSCCGEAIWVVGWAGVGSTSTRGAEPWKKESPTPSGRCGILSSLMVASYLQTVGSRSVLPQCSSPCVAERSTLNVSQAGLSNPLSKWLSTIKKSGRGKRKGGPKRPSSTRRYAEHGSNRSAPVKTLLFEQVAHAANRGDMRGDLRADFGANTTNVHVNRARTAAILKAPYAMQQHLAAISTVGMRGQER
jgi:hypothetical protein